MGESGVDSEGTRAMGGVADARAWPWLLCLAGLALAFRDVFASGFESLPLDPGDPRLIQYLFEHTWAWVSGAPAHADFWSPPLFFPATVVGGYTDTVVALAPPYWLARALGVPGAPAFVGWIMVALALDFVAALWVLRGGFRLARLPASAGAFLLAFGASRAMDLGHPQLMAVFWLLLAWRAVLALFGERAATGRGRRAAWIALLGGALAAQLWSAFYPAFFAALIGATALLFALCSADLRGRLAHSLRHDAWAWLAVGLLAAAAVWPMVRQSLAAAEQAGWRNWSDVESNLPSWTSWIFPGRRHELYGDWVRGPAFEFKHADHHANGFGLVTSVAALLGLWLGRRRPAVRLVLLTTLALLLLASPLPGGLRAWHGVYAWVPGGQAIRYVARLGDFLLWPGALGLALCLQHLLTVGGPARRVMVAVLLIVCIAEQQVKPVLTEWRPYDEAVAALAARVDPDARGFYVVLREDDLRDPALEPPPWPPAEHRRARRAESAAARRLDLDTEDDIDDDDEDTPKAAARAKGDERRTHLLAMFAARVAGIPTINGKFGNGPPGWELGDCGVGTGAQERRTLDVLADWLDTHGVPREQVQVLALRRSELPWLRPD